MSSRERVLELIGRYADGALDAEEMRELESALRGDRELRHLFLKYLNVDTVLSGSTPALLPEKQKTNFIPFRARSAWIGLAAAAFVAIALLVFTWWPKPQRAHAAPSFVTLTAANEAVWSDPNVELALRGGELPPGLLRLESGTAEFLFADGATVVMRGPAVVQFPERKRVFVEAGRIFCRCPSPESRLSVDTPATEVVDLGTEFSVEARPDHSTLVAVLSGEVQVGKSSAHRLRKGEAVEVRGDGILAIQPLAREEFAELLLASPSVNEAVQRGGNLLKDSGFENGLSQETWSGTESNIEAMREGGRSGGAVQIHARGYAHWPQCRQKIDTGDIGGKLVVASVWAAVPAEDPLRSRQTAMLKIVFVNEKGRDFAFAMKRFINSKSAPHRFEQAQVAAFAPPGTRQVQIQLMLQSDLQNAGSVIFDDASLAILYPPVTE